VSATTAVAPQEVPAAGGTAGSGRLASSADLNDPKYAFVCRKQALSEDLIV